MNEISKIICSKCGISHDEIPDIGSNAPDYWQVEYDGKPGCLLTEDLCVIENRDYFIRGVIHIPIINSKESFGWGVWVTQKEENFQNYKNDFNGCGFGPYFGWLSTRIATYSESTLNLKTRAHFRGGKLRPTIEIGPCDHQLFHDQENGIELEKAWEIVHSFIK